MALILVGALLALVGRWALLRLFDRRTRRVFAWALFASVCVVLGVVFGRLL